MKRTILLIAAAGAVACSDGGSGPGATATRLSFTAQPGSAIADTAIPGEIKISVLDQNGGVLTSATSAVTVAIGENPGSASLDGNTTVNAVAGVATFTGLTLNSVGAGYTLVATSPGLVPDTSSTFTVTLSLTDGDGDTYSPQAGDCDDFDTAVHPGATDHPEPTFTDANCDGIDGERDNATFVSESTGDDGPTCGTDASPCATIQQGIDRAVALGRRDVYVVAGHYAVGAFTMADGVSVYGQYGLTYSRSPANVATVTGNRDFPIDGGTQALVVLAENISAPTVLADLRLQGADASARLTTGEGKSAYVIVARDITAGALTITRNTIIAGIASPGRLGANGTNATTLSGFGLNGGAGADGNEFSAACNSTSRGAGGAAGVVSGSGGTLPTAAGAGGRGGTMDTDCSNPFSPNLDARAGEGGLYAAQTTPTGFGRGGVGGTGLNACGDPEPGEPGRVNNGDGGVGASGGVLIGDFWYAKSGGDGQLGDNGGGGGGGGGAGGCDVGTDSYGAGGGGGGAGGRLALGGGERGSGGGGSFGIFLINASVNISSNTITRGIGGNGGAGGIGGQGQSGGLGGPGGQPGGGDDAVGGRGGNGGHGGHGGGGGGGAGGASYGIYLTQGSSATQTGNTFSGGSAGMGGAGGASAPGAPAAERDGHAGQSGLAGTVSDAGTCISSGSC